MLLGLRALDVPGHEHLPPPEAPIPLQEVPRFHVCLVLVGHGGEAVIV